MRTLLSFLLPRKTKKRRARGLTLEYLEDRVTPAANILVASDYDDTLKEYTPGGTLVRSVPLGTSTDVRDLSVSADGSVNVYTGTFNPVNLRTYNASTLAWSDRTLAGWSTVANVSYGGNASYNGYVFVTDMNTGPTATEGAQGIIRFDTAGNTATRFATDISPWDLNIGLDGLLYAFSDSSHIRVYDPNSLALVRTVTIQNI